MNVFVSDNREQGYIAPDNYHWCDDGDLLMFGMFQTEENRKGNEVSMCGINSRKFTTHILVKDIDIKKDFYKELLTKSIEKSMNCEIDEDGNFDVDIAWGFNFNINEIVDELLGKAEQFEDDDKVKCVGRILTKI